MTERETEGPGLDVPEEDALEQRRPLDEEVPDDIASGDDGSADPADRAEQSRAVGTGDDEYR